MAVTPAAYRRHLERAARAWETGAMTDRLSRGEIGKDAVQSVVEAAAGTVGQVTVILTTAVKDVASALGGFATELYEIRDSARRAQRDGDEG
jgi:hypothetical protein